MKNKIKLVAFDLDGVLIDLCESHKIALNKALKEVSNYEISDQRHNDTFNGLPTKVKLHILSEENIVKTEDIDKICELKQKYTVEEIQKFSTDWSKVRMMEVLKDLDVKIAVVSNSIRSTVELALKQIGIYEYVNLIVSNEDIAKPKPAPDGYRYAILLMGVSRDDTLLIEDSDVGFRAALETGANIIRVKDASEVTIETINKYLGYDKTDDLFEGLK
jgi:HAD superfamily hydrolase (TIGR01509 family)